MRDETREPSTLNPQPYILHPEPYTLYCTPYTLHPKPQEQILVTSLDFNNDGEIDLPEIEAALRRLSDSVQGRFGEPYSALYKPYSALYAEPELRRKRAINEPYIRGGKERERALHTLNPKPETRNPKPRQRW